MKKTANIEWHNQIEIMRLKLSSWSTSFHGTVYLGRLIPVVNETEVKVDSSLIQSSIFANSNVRCEEDGNQTLLAIKLLLQTKSCACYRL